MNRRGFLQSILAAGVAPAIVRAGSLMQVSGIIIPAREIVLPSAGIIARDTASIKVARFFSTALGSRAFDDATREGLIEVRRYPQGRTTVVDFAIEKPATREVNIGLWS